MSVQAHAGEHWVATWAASAQPADPPLSLQGQTIRQLVHVSVGGSRLRVRLSNVHGTTPLRIGAAHVARPSAGGAIAHGSDRRLTFGGAASVVVPVGALVVSDPLPLAVTPLSDLAVSLYLPGGEKLTTGHGTALETTYVSAAGDFSGADRFPNQSSTHAWYLLSGVEVDAAANARAIVALGDSITDGMRATADANRRWPDRLAQRLDGLAGAAPRAVVNAGISGNCLLRDLVGLGGLARLDRDALTQAGAGYLVLLEGVNDIGVPAEAPDRDPTVEELIVGYRQVIERAHALGLAVIGATLLPMAGSQLFSPAAERKRLALNQWIRAGGAYDGVIDFERAVRDPAQPTRLAPAFDSGDHCHPNDAGYRAMADAVDLGLFYETRATR